MFLHSPTPVLTWLPKTKTTGQEFWKHPSAFIKYNRGTKPFPSEIGFFISVYHEI